MIPDCTCGHDFSLTGMFHIGDCPRKSLPMIVGPTETVAPVTDPLISALLDVMPKTSRGKVALDYQVLPDYRTGIPCDAADFGNPEPLARQYIGVILRKAAYNLRLGEDERVNMLARADKIDPPKETDR